MKMIVAIIMAMAMTLCLTACSSLDINKVKGDWTLSTVNDKTVEEYAAELGTDAYLVVVNATVTDKEYISENAEAKASYPISVKTDGFEVLASEGGDIMMSVRYDSAKDTLAYSVDIEGTVYEYVLVRGTGILTAPAENSAEGEEQASAEA